MLNAIYDITCSKQCLILSDNPLQTMRNGITELTPYKILIAIYEGTHSKQRLIISENSFQIKCLMLPENSFQSALKTIREFIPNKMVNVITKLITNNLMLPENSLQTVLNFLREFILNNV